MSGNDTRATMDRVVQGSRGAESAAPGASAREPARSATSAASAFGASFAVATGCSGSSSCSEPRPLLKLLIAWPRLLPSCGSFEGPKKSNASASTTRISPMPSLIRASTGPRAARPATPRPELSSGIRSNSPFLVVVEVPVLDVSGQWIRQPGPHERLLVDAAAAVVANAVGEDCVQSPELIGREGTPIVARIDFLQLALEDVLRERLARREPRIAVHGVHLRAGRRVREPLTGHCETGIDEAGGLVPDHLRRGAATPRIVDDVLYPLVDQPDGHDLDQVQTP